MNVKDFENLSLLLPMSTPEGKYIQQIENYTEDLDFLQSEVGKFNSPLCKTAIHEALWQCQSLFNEVKGKVGSKKILLFTANDDPHANDTILKKQALKKGKDLQDTDVILEVIPFTKDFDFSNFYADLAYNDDLEARKLDQSEIGDVTKLNDLMTIVRKKVHIKRSSGRCHLELGPGVKLSVATYSFVMRASKPSKVRLTRDTNQEVKTVRQFSDPQTGAPLLPSDIDKFVEFAGKRIKFTQDEIRTMAKNMMGGSFGFKLICFKPKASMNWSEFVRSSNFIYPDETSIKGSRRLFSALYTKCLQKNLIAICNYKPRQVSTPSFVALIPLEEVKDVQDGTQKVPPGFMVFYLPFSDDIRDIPLAPQAVEPTEGQLEAASKVIKKLKMKYYNVEQFENPAIQGHYRLIEQLALFKTDEEDPGDTSMPDFDMQRKRLGERSQAFIEAMQPTPDQLSACSSYAEPAPPPPPPAKRLKVEKLPIDMTQMEKLVESKKVDSLKVDELKTFLKSVGCGVSNKTKVKLVQDVYDHFVI